MTELNPQPDVPGTFEVPAALRELLDAGSIGVGLFDGDLRYVAVNAALADINGISAERHVGRRVGDVVPDLGSQVEPLLVEVLRTGRPAVDVVVRGRTAAHDSAPREWVASFHRVGAIEGAPGVGVIVSDVTERRRSERRVRQLMDGLFTFVGLCDPDGVLIEANRTALDAAGLEPADVIGRPFWDAYWWSYDEGVQRQLRDAVARAREGVASRYDVDVRVKGGELLTIDFQLVPIIESDEVTALVPSGMDVHDRRRNERQLEATAMLARELSGTRSTDDVIDVVLNWGARAVGADFVNVALVDQHRVQLFHPEHLRLDVADRYRALPLDAPVPMCDAIRTRSEITVRDAATHDGRYAQFFDDVVAAGYAHVVAIPLYFGGKVIGAIGAAWRPDRHLGLVDDSRMAIVAKLSAQTLGRTLRSDRQEEFITILQRQLMPLVPVVDHLDIAVSFQPSGDGIGFGGDWFDIVTLDADRTAFIVGDIAGHGIEAAAEMTVVRSAINSLIRLDTPLDQLLHRAQMAVAPAQDRFIGTVAVAVIDTARHTLDYVTAGHLAPLIREPDGTATFADHLANPPLGITAPTAALGHARFAPGATATLYTDGLVERRREPIDVGLERLRAAIADCGDDASGTISCVTERLRPPSGAWTDDVALVVVRHAPAV